MYYWNELEMNTNVFTSTYVFISSLGLTPYYNMVFLIVKMVGLMSVLSTDHRDHSLSYEHELFSWSSKKSLTERILNIYITVLLCIRFRFFTTNESDYISVWTKMPIKCSVCCVGFIWVICLRLTVLHDECDPVSSL